MEANTLATEWYDLFSRYAADLYPGRYTREKCLQLAEQAVGMVEHAHRSATQKFIVATEKGMVYRLRKECPQKPSSRFRWKPSVAT